MTPPEHNCDNCEWLHYETTPECRRFPPVYVANQALGQWPNVNVHYWCGEFKVRESIDDGWE